MPSLPADATPFAGAPSYNTQVPDPRASGTLRASKTSVYPGDAVTFSGQVGTRTTEQRLSLQVKRNGRWREIEGRYARQAGRFRLREFLDFEPGRYVFRVVGLTGWLTNAPRTVTPTVKVKVLKRPGSLALPWRPGQQFEAGDWRFTLGPTDTDAWPEVIAANPTAAPPPPGWSYVAVPLSVTRAGTTASGVYWSANIDFVGSDGVVYSRLADVNGQDVTCSLNDDWTDTPELYPGGTASASACIPVHSSSIAGGVWRVEGDDYIDWYVSLS